MVCSGACRLPGGGRVHLPRDRRLERATGRRDPLVQRATLDRRLGHGLAFGGSPPFRVGEPSPGGFSFRLARRGRPTKGGRLLAPCPAGHPQRAELGQRVREGTLGVADRGVKLEIARRDRLGEGPALNGEIRLGRRPLIAESRPVTTDRLEIAAETSLAETELSQRRPCGIVGLPPTPFGLCPFTQLGGDRCSRLLRCLEGRHGLVGLGSFVVSSRARLGRPTRGFVPADVGSEDERLGQLVACREPCRLLLRLGREPAGLRPQLTEDVLDASQVRLRLDELVLRLAATPLVTTDPRDLLEKRAALLRAKGERLVDHALPDEQERVVGQMSRVEQVDQVAQADALLVEQVVVLAAAVEPTTELQD